MLENPWSAVGNPTSALSPSGSSFGPSGLAPVCTHHLLLGNLTTASVRRRIRSPRSSGFEDILAKPLTQACMPGPIVRCEKHRTADLDFDVAHPGVDDPEYDDQQSDECLDDGVYQMNAPLFVSVPQVQRLLLQTHHVLFTGLQLLLCARSS